MFGSLRSMKVCSLVIVALLNACLFVSSAHAIFLPPGWAVALGAGTNPGARPELAGPMVHNQVVHFKIFNAAGALLFEGDLHSWIIRSGMTGRLHFYHRIINTVPGLNGVVTSIRSQNFTGFITDVDWRNDIPGTKAWSSAMRNAVGSTVAFNVAMGGIVGPQTTRPCVNITNAWNFGFGGVTSIHLSTGDFVTLATMRPM